MADNVSLPSLAHAATPNTLVGTAYVNLRRDIIEGKHPPGSRLRVEHLKDDYGEGAGTLREALALLVSDALVTSHGQRGDRKSTRLNSSHVKISYAVFCLKKETDG